MNDKRNILNEKKWKNKSEFESIKLIEIFLDAFV